MKKALCILTALFAMTWASAQTSSSGQTSGSSDQSSASSTSKQTTKKGTKKGGGETTLTGCLSGPNAEGAYELQHGKKKVEVGGNDELSKHVGHTVKLHGTWTTSSEIGEKETAEKGEAKGEKSEKGERHFKVSSIDHVSDTCQAGAAAGGHHHKMGGMSGGGAASPSPSPSPQP